MSENSDEGRLAVSVQASTLGGYIRTLSTARSWEADSSRGQRSSNRNPRGVEERQREVHPTLRRKASLRMWILSVLTTAASIEGVPRAFSKGSEVSNGSEG